MKNILAIIVGVVTALLMLTLTVYMCAYFNIGPGRQILSVNFTDATILKVAKFLVFVVLPLSSFVASFVEALIARNEKICAIFTVIPLVIISCYMPSFYLALSITIITVSMLAGIYAATSLKCRA